MLIKKPRKVNHFTGLRFQMKALFAREFIPFDPDFIPEGRN
jgi:hypothetical protein